MLKMLLDLKFLDLVDILILTLIFYRIYRLFKGTRALQVLKGLSILIITLLIAQIAHLQTINWILKNFWAIWIVALIVIFQPELRRALARLGENPLSRLFFPEEEKFIEEITRGVRSLSRRKIGSLIVIERKTGLKNYVETGVRLESRVSSELLNSIFIPKSPLHDGAIIIQENRIAAASCLLPLTQNPSLSKTLGTRHRAALGLSEETDALSIVISEETGSISLAVNGRMTPNLEIRTLQEMLESYLETSES
jgi:diadenylate cyclase